MRRERHNPKRKERYERWRNIASDKIYKALVGRAIKLENSIYFAYAGPNVGRTRDEINLRSFLGIKSGWSVKFGLQPGERPRPLRERDTPTRERGIMRIFNLCFAPLYFTRRWWNGLFSHDSSFLRGLDVIYRDLYQAGFKIRVDSPPPSFFTCVPFSPLSSLISCLLPSFGSLWTILFSSLRVCVLCYTSRFIFHSSAKGLASYVIANGGDQFTFVYNLEYFLFRFRNFYTLIDYGEKWRIKFSSLYL